MSNQQEFGNAAGLLWEGAQERLEILEVRFTTDNGWNLGARIIPRKPSRFLKFCVAVDRWIGKVTGRARSAA